jgi:flagella basal body P-ring formation protein FlgA
MQMPLRANRGLRARSLALLVSLVCLAGGVQAQLAAEPDYQGMALAWARTAALAAAPSVAKPLKIEVSVGPLDARLHLAPCGNVEAYLPPGARLWGRSRVGLRCVDGMGRWNVSLPLTVKAIGTAWLIRGQVAPGAALVQADVVEAEVDWAEENSPVLLESASWLGQIATRQLSTGQVLRQGMVKPVQVFQAGMQIRVVAAGDGFQVSADAFALSAGVVGQIARVRMDNGRIATGVVLDARTVKIEL